jgi:hypothetical protein
MQTQPTKATKAEERAMVEKLWPKTGGVTMNIVTQAALADKAKSTNPRRRS